MHLHTTLILVIWGSVLLNVPPAIGQHRIKGSHSFGPLSSPETVINDFLCYKAKTCVIHNIRLVPNCFGMKIVDTSRSNHLKKDSDAPGNCWNLDRWLLRGDGSPPVLLISECMIQERPDQPGDSTTELYGCDFYIRHFNNRKASRLIREVWIQLDSLKPYRMIESDGMWTGQTQEQAPNPATRRAIRLPLGKGIQGSPLIDIDGPATLDKEVTLPKLVIKTSDSVKSTGEPPCIGSRTCQIHRTWNLPECGNTKMIDIRSTLGPTVREYSGECEDRSYWLVRGAGKEPVFVTHDCVAQNGPDETGTSSVQIEKCNLLFKYMEQGYDRDCITRDVGINLNTMQVFLETEREGTFNQQDNDCKSKTSRKKTIQLRRGEGILENPIIHLHEIESKLKQPGP